MYPGMCSECSQPACGQTQRYPHYQHNHLQSVQWKVFLRFTLPYARNHPGGDMNGSNKEFYNQTAEQYDAMISYEKAVQAKKQVLAGFVKPGMQEAADFGCGTGVDSFALAELGLRVDSFDQSESMIAMARQRMMSNHQITFTVTGLDAVQTNAFPKKDLIVSLGNTCANIPPQQLRTVFQHCAAMMKPDGTLLLQNVNVTRMRQADERIVKISYDGTKQFIRFYDYCHDMIRFNILTIEGTQHQIISTVVYEYTQEALTEMLTEAGFRNIQAYGSLKKDSFVPGESKDIVIEATK